LIVDAAGGVDVGNTDGGNGGSGGTMTPPPGDADIIF